MKIKIRNGNEKDFPAIMKMIKELAAFLKESDAVRNSAEQMMKEKDLFSFLVALCDGKIVGYALYFFAYSTWVGKSLYLEDIYVKPDFRGQKVGSILLRRIFEIAKEGRCRRVQWQVLEWNEDAIKFYEKRGAEIHKGIFDCYFDEKSIDRVLSDTTRYSGFYSDDSE
jgi:GNAT superfamily N-acetyltransferase